MLIACGLVLFVTACQTDSEQAQARIITFAIATGASNLDPRFATDATSERVNRLLYDSLIRLDETMLPKPFMAEWQRLSSVHYRFTLLSERRAFSNGRLPMADDVVETYRFILDSGNQSPHRQSISLIHAVEQVNPLTIDFRLIHADPLFPAYLTQAILPAELIRSEHDFKRYPSGSGPFTLKENRLGESIYLKRRHDGQIVRLMQVRDPTVRLLKLINQEIDLLQNDISPESMDYLSRQAGVRHLNQSGSNFTYLGMNLQDKILSDPLVRQAIAHAIDRQAIIHHVFGDRARTAESILPASHWAGNDQLKPYPFNPQKARQLLGSLGYDQNNPLKLSYKTSSDPFRIRLATIIQHQLQAVGIQVTINSYDWGTFFGDIKSGQFQLYSLSWVGIRTPDIFRYVFHSGSLPPEGANRGGYQSAHTDRLLDQVAEQASLDQQARFYQLIQEQVHKDLPYVPLWYEDQNAFTLERVSGYQLAPDGNYDALNHVRIN